MVFLLDLLSIADLGEVTEEKLLKALQISPKHLIIALIFRLFLISTVIVLINLVVLYILWEAYIIWVDFSWLLLLEGGIVLFWAGIGGSVRSSITVNKLFQMITKGSGEPINRAMINKALGNTISMSLLGVFLIIYSIIVSSLGYRFLFN